MWLITYLALHVGMMAGRLLLGGVVIVGVKLFKTAAQ